MALHFVEVGAHVPLRLERFYINGIASQSPPLVCLCRCSEGVPDYFKIVKNPMDLGTVHERLKKNKYPNHQAFAADVRLVFSNCRLFNSV